MIRLARLPRPMKRRPQTKLVLLALGDRCNHAGGDAFPSVATIAAESEISQNIADACLEALSYEGLICEQAPPTMRRPRTWAIDVEVLRVIIDDRAQLAKLDLRLAMEGPSDGQNLRSDGQNLNSGGQKSNSDGQIDFKSTDELSLELSSELDLNAGERGARAPLRMVKSNPRAVANAKTGRRTKR
jgi:hypothetical protein